MNYSFFSAGVLSGITFAVHIFVGGPDILSPMIATGMPADQTAVWTVVWHAISIAMAIGTAALLFEAIKPGRLRSLIWGICAQYFGIAVLFIYYGIVNLGTLWPMPQWIAFLLIVFFAVLGLWREKAQPA